MSLNFVKIRNYLFILYLVAETGFHKSQHVSRAKKVLIFNKKYGNCIYVTIIMVLKVWFVIYNCSLKSMVKINKEKEKKQNYITMPAYYKL